MVRCQPAPLECSIDTVTRSCYIEPDRLRAAVQAYLIADTLATAIPRDATRRGTAHRASRPTERDETYI